MASSQFRPYFSTFQNDFILVGPFLAKAFPFPPPTSSSFPHESLYNKATKIRGFSRAQNAFLVSPSLLLIPHSFWLFSRPSRIATRRRGEGRRHPPQLELMWIGEGKGAIVHIIWWWWCFFPHKTIQSFFIKRHRFSPLPFCLCPFPVVEICPVALCPADADPPSNLHITDRLETRDFWCCLGDQLCSSRKAGTKESYWLTDENVHFLKII